MRRMLGSLEFLEVYRSQANFLLARLTPGAAGADAKEASDGLARQGVFVRYFDTPRLRDCLRFSVGLPGHTERLIQALQQQGGERAS